MDAPREPEKRRGNLSLTSIGILISSCSLLFMLAPPAALSQEVDLSVLVHLADLGDRGGTGDSWVGTKGQSRPMEGFIVQQSQKIPGLHLEYMCHIQDFGDTPWMGERSFCGTRGRSKRIEGFSIRLAGPRKDEFELRYRCHLAHLGDTSWKQAGEFCGTRGESRSLQAFYVTLKQL